MLNAKVLTSLSMVSAPTTTKFLGDEAGSGDVPHQHILSLVTGFFTLSRNARRLPMFLPRTSN
jgi:hypothetical protein